MSTIPKKFHLQMIPCHLRYLCLLFIVWSSVVVSTAQAKTIKHKATLRAHVPDMTNGEVGTLSQRPVISINSELPLRKSVQSFKDLGASRPLTLLGTVGEASVGMSVRIDEMVESAQLHLTFTLSPALLPNLSHLKILFNEEVLQTIVVDKEKVGSPQTLSLSINPRFFTDYNNLRFQLIGHYTMDCEMPHHTSLWASISNESRLELTLRQLPLKNDLALLPTPFFDKRDGRALMLPFVYPAAPSQGLLKASGSIASWMGAQASYRGAHFPVFENRLPQQHAVVIASNAQRPYFLKDLAPVDKPTLSMIGHPLLPGYKLLLVLGKDDAQVQLAADTLALEKAALSGQTIEIDALAYPTLRAAYDSPRWMTSKRPVQLAELVRSPDELQVRGAALNDSINISTHMAPDLFTWNVSGVPLNLKYRYTPTSQSINGTLNVSINTQFIKSYPLKSNEANNGDFSSSVLLPLFDDGTLQSKSDLKIPAFLIGGDNQLQFAFQIPPVDLGRCSSSQPTELRAILDPQSTLDLSAFDHYIAMPNIAAFANSGFPFTKYADLAQTSVVLPAHPSPAEINLYLTALGRMGASTGHAATRFRLLTPAQLEEGRDTDILLVADASNSALAVQWGKDLPALIEAGKRSIRPLKQALESFFDLFNLETEIQVSSSGASAVLVGTGALAAITGFESPLNKGRSVISLSATDGASLELIGKVLNDPGQVKNLRGDLSLIQGGRVESFRINPVFYVGDMPWWRRLWFHLHIHPLLLAALGLGAGLLLSFIAFVTLQTLAQRRLLPPDGA